MASDLKEIAWWNDPWPFVERMAKGEYILPEVQRQVFATALLQLRGAVRPVPQPESADGPQ